MTTGVVVEVKTLSGKSLFASIVPVRKKVSYNSTRIWPKDTIDMLSRSFMATGPRHILVEVEAAVANRYSLLAFVSPILVIQYAPNQLRRLNALAFADLIKELLECPDLGIAKKGKLLPALEKIIDDRGLVFDHYVLRSFVFRRIPILVIMDKPDQPWLSAD